jgi:hypothetical protein
MAVSTVDVVLYLKPVLLDMTTTTKDRTDLYQPVHVPHLCMTVAFLAGHSRQTVSRVTPSLVLL